MMMTKTEYTPVRRARDTATALTTFQVARLLGVSADTVANWVDQGRIAAHRTPGGHRRVPREALVQFAHQHGLPLQGVSAPVGTVDDAERRPLLLVVDDDDDFAHMVASYLSRKHGWDVEVACGALEACVRAGRRRPDAVLVDIRLPGPDGFDVLGALRSDVELAGVPVYACTGWQDPRVEHRVQDASFAGFLRKPVDVAAFGRLLDTAGAARAAR